MNSSLLLYRRIASPLHATRAGVGVVWVGALTVATLLLFHPLALLALVVAVLCAGAGAGVGRRLARSMRMLAIDGDLRIILTVSEITIEMSEGEVMQIAATGRAPPIASPAANRTACCSAMPTSK